MKNRNEITKIIIYIVLVLLCVFVFVKYGMQESEDVYSTSGNENDPVKTIEPTGFPSAYRLDYILNLKDTGIQCSFSEPVEKGNAIQYELTFTEPNIDGNLIFTVNEANLVIRCELEVGMPYVGEVIGEGLVKDAVREGYKVRRAFNQEVFECYLVAMVKCMDNNMSVSNADMMNAINDIMQAYDELSTLDKKYGDIRIVMYVKNRTSVRIEYGLIIEPK